MAKFFRFDHIWINHYKVTFFSARTCPNFHMCASLRFRVRERDSENIYDQRDVENYTDQVLNFLLFDRHEYIHTEPSGLQFSSAYLCYGFIWLFLCSSRFDWQNRFLFPEKSFSEELASYWLLTLYVTSFSDVNKQPSREWRCVNWKGEIMAESGRWVSNIKLSILLKKGWFSNVGVSLKWE